jgi:hypothetical protein
MYERDTLYPIGCHSYDVIDTALSYIFLLKRAADHVSAAKIFPHSAFSRADISLTYLNPMQAIRSSSVLQYLVLFLACVAGLAEIMM